MYSFMDKCTLFCCCYFNKNVAVEAVWFREGHIPISLSLSLGSKSFLGISVFPFSHAPKAYSMWLV